MYRVNETFVSVQGEGANAGKAMWFVRFAGCNLRCNGVWADGVYQPVCDTQFESGREMSAEDIAEAFVMSRQTSVLLTGGEPSLQVDRVLVSALRDAVKGAWVGIETNGTRELPEGIDYVCVSPKTAEHALALRSADELRYVMAYGQSMPKPRIQALRRYLSPAWQPDGSLRASDLAWCIDQIKQNPDWRLSVQLHKFMGIR